MNKKSATLLLAEALLALLSGITFFFGFQILAADFADFSHLWRMGPAILSYWLLLYVLFVFHIARKTEDATKREKLLRTNAWVLCSLSLVLFIWIVSYIGMGLYPQDGMLNAIFPYDILLLAGGSFLFALGILLLFRFPRPESAPRAKEKLKGYPLLKKILHSVFYPFFALIALYELGGLILGLDFIPADSPSFPFAIPAYIAMLFPSVLLLLREIWRSLENPKIKFALQIALPSLGILLGVLPLFMLIPAPNYVELLFHPFYPLDFMGSLRVSIYLWSLPNMLAPLFFFIGPSLEKRFH